VTAGRGGAGGGDLPSPQYSHSNARPRSEIRFQRKTEFRRYPPAFGNVEFDPGSWPPPVLSPTPLSRPRNRSSLTLAFSPPGDAEVDGQKPSAAKRNQEERRERCTARRVHCSSEPGGVRASGARAVLPTSVCFPSGERQRERGSVTEHPGVAGRAGGRGEEGEEHEAG